MMTIMDLIDILEIYGKTEGYDLPVRVRGLDRHMIDIEDIQLYETYEGELFIGIEA